MATLEGLETATLIIKHDDAGEPYYWDLYDAVEERHGRIGHGKAGSLAGVLSAAIATASESGAHDVEVIAELNNLTIEDHDSIEVGIPAARRARLRIDVTDWAPNRDAADRLARSLLREAR